MKPDDENRPFQYTLRTMFVVMTLLAAALSALYASPPLEAVVSGICVLLLISAALTVLLVYGRGYVRTFCIGALFPPGWMLWSYTQLFLVLPQILMMRRFPSIVTPETVDFVRNSVAACFVLSLVFGMLAMGLRWLIEPRRQVERRTTALGEPAEPVTNQGDPPHTDV